VYVHHSEVVQSFLAHSASEVCLESAEGRDVRELAAGNVDGPLDVNDNHKALTITSKKVTSSHESWGGPRGIGPTAPNFLGGTRPTRPIGWLRL